MGKAALSLEEWKDVHASNNQEGSADKAHVANGLENTTKSLRPGSEDQKNTDNLDYDQSLGTAAKGLVGGSGL